MSESSVELPVAEGVVKAADPWLRRVLRALASDRMVLVWLGVILLVGAAFRFTGINWDDNQHLHPDERFLTMVETAIQWPTSLSQYFDSAHSPLSPYNHNFGFYVYGTFPLFLVKGLGLLLHKDNYDQIALLGRVVSGLFDLGSIVFLFLIGRRLFGNKVALLGAALSSLAVLQIQQAHFFTTDSFANLFVVSTVYFAVRCSEEGRWWDYALMGISLGMGVASKISVFTLAVICALAGGLYIYRGYIKERDETYATFKRVILLLILAAGCSLVTFRVLQPITFNGPGFFGLSLNSTWLSNMGQLGGLMSGAVDYPPGDQWTNRTILLFPWENMVAWGLGVPLGLAAWAGWALGVWELVWRRKLNLLLPVAYVALVFVHQGTQWVKSMRYFLPIYPFLALMAAYLLVWVWEWARNRYLQRAGDPSEKDAPPGAGWKPAVPGGAWRWLAGLLGVVVIGGTLLYALAFTSIYTRPHSRVAASRWIYANVPKGSFLANEIWDDPLPLRVDGNDGFGGWYTGVDMGNYDEDTPQKLTQMVANLTKADYIILSSNRLYDSIPRLPMRYPMTVRYYKYLFSGQLGFEKVAEFTSYPQLFGIQLPDQSAEEAFSVYDHPKVTIFKKSPSFSAEYVQHLLGDGIDWNGIQRLTPKQATQGVKVPTGPLLIPGLQPAGDTWSQIFDRTGLTNHYPELSWLLIVELISLCALPLAFVVFRQLPDRGYLLAKTLGILLVAYLAWLVAALHLQPYDRATIMAVLGLVAVVSGYLFISRRREMVNFVRQRWSLLLVGEVVFLIAFVGFFELRMHNPDLWHPYRGGEKPMDFAFLNAVVRTSYFPPYDPWFAGGYLNYYYFGQVIVATLIKLSGIVPVVSYNLAVALLFALTIGGAFCVVYNLVEVTRLRLGKTKEPGPEGNGDDGDDSPSSPTILSVLLSPAVLAAIGGALFVAVLGNLDGLLQMVSGLQKISTVAIQSNIPGVAGLASVVTGFWSVLTGQRGLPPFDYWRSSRMMPQGSLDITEFPYFTFLFADLHAHLISMPITVLGLGLALSVTLTKNLSAKVLKVFKDDQGTEEATPEPALGAGLPAGWARTYLLAAWQRLGAVQLLLLALVLGALRTVNSWDFPTYLGIATVAVAIQEYASRRRLDLGLLVWVAVKGLLLYFLSTLLFLPFFQAYQLFYSGVELSKWKTPLPNYLAIHGLFLFAVLSFVLRELYVAFRHTGPVRTLRLGVRQWQVFPRYVALYRRLVHRPNYVANLVFLAGVFLVSVALIAAILDYTAVAFLLLVFGLLIPLVWHELVVRGPAMPVRLFVLLLIGVAVALGIGVDFITIKGDINRMNTIFKFYIQAWVLFAVASAYGLWWLFTQGRPQGSRWTRGLWLGALAFLVGSAAIYPIAATPVRLADRFAQLPPTGDGSAFMQVATYQDEKGPIVLKWDLQAITWLEDNIQGTPVIMEGITPLYRWGSRISVYTGLPDVLGWDWHEKQQRAGYQSLVDERETDVNTFFSTTDTATALRLLSKYDVSLIYVGQVERLYYPQTGIAKFDTMVGQNLDIIYQNDQVKIYRVRR